MGTLASKVGENIVGKRLGMSEKDRKLLGTVFGMAGGAYGGYAGQAGFGSTAGSAFTAPGGQSAGMAGASPKVGGDYGTAMNLFSQPTQYDAMASMTPGMDMYSNASFGTNPHSGFNEFTGGYDVDLMGGQGYASQYDQMAGMPAESYGMDSFRINDYDRMASMPARSYGMDMYAARPGNEMFSIGRPDNTWVNLNKSIYKGPNWFDNALVPEPRFQGGPSGNVSAQTYALDTPSRTIDLAPSGAPLEVTDVSAYTAPPEPFYGVDPNSPTASGSNLGMESVYNSGGNPDIELVPSTGDRYLISPDDQVRLIEVNPDGTVTELPADTDFTNSKQVREAINIDAQLAAERDGVVLHDRRAAAERFEPYMDVYNPATAQAAETLPPLVNPNSPTANYGDQLYQQGVVDSASIKASEAKYLGVKNLDSRVAEATTYSPTQSQVSQVSLDDPQGTIEGLAAEAKAVEEVKAQMLQDAGDGKFNLSDLLDKIPDAVKEWATMTGVSLLDMWIKQSLFGQDYDDQIAEGGGGGGGGVLRGSSPVVSPYSGGGSGGGGKGVLFSMGGSGQQGRGTHIMALQ